MQKSAQPLQQKHNIERLVLAFIMLFTMVFGAFQWFGKLNEAHAAQVTITKYPLSNGSLPHSITAGPDGNLWFTKSTMSMFGVNKIERITPKGVISEYPLPNSNSDPGDITAGPDGSLWFTEAYWSLSGGYYICKIGSITQKGIISEYPLPNSNLPPGAITVGPDGNLWFTDPGANKIGRITLQGVISEYPIPISNSNPGDITTGPDGNLWFTGFYWSQGNSIGQIGRITPKGVVTEYPLPSSNSTPIGITAGPDGNLWFTGAYSSSLKGQVGRITPKGAITEYPLSNRAYNIVTGPDGNLWFNEDGMNPIVSITPSGAITEYPFFIGSYPGDLTTGPDGNLWFTGAYYAELIGRVNLVGTMLLSGQWFLPIQGFTVQKGHSISLSIQADSGTAHIADVTINAVWSRGSRKVCDLKKPDSKTGDRYSCHWNFTVAGQSIPAGQVIFHMTIIATDGNRIFDPGGPRMGTFK